jgi:hypothetical protein
MLALAENIYVILPRPSRKGLHANTFQPSPQIIDKGGSDRQRDNSPYFHDFQDNYGRKNLNNIGPLVNLI